MALISHTPTDNRAQLYGKPCQDNHLDPRRSLTSRPEWFGYYENQHANSIKFAPKNIVTHAKGGNPKKVIDNATGIIYDSINQAAKDFGLNPSCIDYRLRKGYFSYVDQDAPRMKRIKNVFTGEVYENIHKAVELSGYALETIRKHCNARLKTKRFEYVD